MSLDDMIAAKSATVPKGGKRNFKRTGPVKSASNKKHTVRAVPHLDRSRKPDFVAKITQPQQVAAKPQLSVFARLGKPPVSGTRVNFSNLKSSVRENDLRELCSALGEIKEVDFMVGKNGKNSAIVLFARRSDALTCVSNLNGIKLQFSHYFPHRSINQLLNIISIGMTLDGYPMEVSITGESAELAAPKSVFDRLQGVSAVQNVRQGLFGTAMDSNKDGNIGSAAFLVSLSGDNRGAKSQKLVQPFSVQNNNGGGSSNTRGFSARFNQHDDRVTQDVIIKQPFDRAESRQVGGRYNQRGGSKTYNTPRVSGRGPEKRSAQPMDLDADLDAYFATK